MNVREQPAESQEVEEKYLDVPEAGTKISKENDAMIARRDYWTVATHYGYVDTNVGDRVMEELADRVPGVNDMESRTLSADDGLDVGGRHIEIRSLIPTLLAGCEHTTPTRERTYHEFAPGF